MSVTVSDGSHLLRARAVRLPGRHLRHHDDGTAIGPCRDLGSSGVDEFYALLSTIPNFRWISPDLGNAGLEAIIRARID